ncbi:thioesterase domain-containing protein [Shewanella denitrificans]|nr:thioesterase domain-containing protein [Shewanella denitrificans]
MTETAAETQDAKGCDLIKRDLLSQLERTWHQTIPVSEFMQIAPLSFDDEMFTVTAPLTPNINLHQTMFAGSIYTLMTLTGWGMVWLQQKRQGITADIVLADAKIKYHAPVTEAPMSQVIWPASTKAQLDSQTESQATAPLILNSDFADLYRRNKMSHHLEVHLYSGKILCATFNGRYVSLKKPI